MLWELQFALRLFLGMAGNFSIQSASIPIQVAGLKDQFPFGETTWAKNRVRWYGKISPNEFAREYTVEMVYQIGDSPSVWVREPDLKILAGGRPLPHVYDSDTQKLCLYLPGGNYWGPEKSIAATIMPWACLWLHYFELWLITGIWHGKGEHPVAGDKKENNPQK